MSTASKAPFNWLTQSSLDTYTDYSSVGTEMSTSLMFTVGTADMATRTAIRRPSLKPRPGFGQQRTGAQLKKKEKANGIIIYFLLLFYYYFLSFSLSCLSVRWAVPGTFTDIK